MYTAQTSAQEQLPMADDAITVKLGYQRISPGQFLLLYDSTPHLIDHGHIAMRVGCDKNGEPQAVIVAGIAPNVSPVDLDYVEPLSEPGYICTYHGHVPEGSTDIALLNPSEQFIRLPPEATVTIHAMHPIEAAGGHE